MEPWTILSLFDWSGNWTRPYREAGYPVIQIDLLTGTDLRTFDYTRIPKGSVRGILAAVPCTDFSRAGAHLWPAKDADGRTAASIALAERTMDIIDYHAPHWWCVENPEGRIGQLVPRIGLQRVTTINPKDFGDGYTKATVLFGKFCPFMVQAPVAKYIRKVDRKHHAIDRWSEQMYPGIPRKHRRSITPMGFARAFFQANP